MNGKKAESLAALYLRMHGYRILDRNYNSRFGEIDIIAKYFNTVVFVEVKARGEGSLAAPACAVDVFKQKKIIKTAQLYILYKNLDGFDLRFDVLELTKQGRNTKINHIKNAFGE